MALKVIDFEHRGKDRVRELGEVFTPETYVGDMLKLLDNQDQKFWNDENKIFFEPCCGHGNIVITILKKRLDAIYKNVLSNKSKEAALYSIANTVNTLWAIDIDASNITHCRSRVLKVITDFLQEKARVSNQFQLLRQNQDFFAHLVCAISRHIHENETLSSLSCDKTASINANKTRSSAKWLKTKGHKPIEFYLNWVEYFEEHEKQNAVPIEYQRALKLIEKIVAGKNHEATGFEFVRDVFSTSEKQSRHNINIELQVSGG